MYRLKSLAIPLLIAVLLFSMVIDAQAQNEPPTMPSSFYGEIHFISNPPSIGSTVEAFVPGHATAVATTTVKNSGGNLVYNLNVPGDDADTPGGDENDVVTFYVDGQVVAAGVWHSGTNARLNFHPPAATAGTWYVGAVGESIQFSGSASDWLVTDTFAFAWDLDDDGQYDDSYLQNPLASFSTPGSSTVRLRVTDGQGGQGFASAMAVVTSFEGLTGQTYDGNPHAVTVSGVVPPLTYSVTYDGSLTAPTSAGSYAVIAQIYQDAELIGSIADALTISPKSASVTPQAAGKTYGDVDPTLVGSLSGFMAGDSVTASYSRAPGEDAGTYAIQATLSPSAVLSNYQITYNTADFTIGPRSITVTAVDGQAKIYGDADPAFAYTASDEGILFSGALERAPGEQVRAYALNMGTLTAGDNYTINFVSADFVIDPRPVTVTADAMSKVFGAMDPELTYQITNGSLVSGDAFTGTVSRVVGEQVGTYAIQQGTLGLSSNYTLTFVPAVFSITPAHHSITLAAGWNLVSFNLHPTSTAIDDVLASIEGNYDLVYAWDASGEHAGSSGNWLKYDNLPQTTDSLDTLDEGMGFWIHMTAADTLDVYGTYQPSTSINLRTGAQGWNLVAYPSAVDGALPAALSEHGAADFSLIYAYHAGDSADPWKLFDRSGADYANDLTVMSPGWGYWVKVDAENTWSIAY